MSLQISIIRILFIVLSLKWPRILCITELYAYVEADKRISPDTTVTWHSSDLTQQWPDTIVTWHSSDLTQ